MERVEAPAIDGITYLHRDLLGDATSIIIYPAAPDGGLVIELETLHQFVEELYRIKIEEELK